MFGTEAARRGVVRARLQQDRGDARRSTRGASPTDGRAQRHHRRHRRLRAGQHQQELPVHREGHVPDAAATRSRSAFLYEDVDYSQVNQNTGPTFTAPDGRQTATGARIIIVPDLNFGRIYRVTRANFNVERADDAAVLQLLRAGPVEGDRSADRQRRPALRGSGARRHDLGTLAHARRRDARRVPPEEQLGAAPRRRLRRARRRPVALYANWGRFFARIPNDLAARALSVDEGITRGDYFDAGLTRPIPNGTVTQTPTGAPITQHFLLAGTGTDLIDPDAKLSYKDEFVAGYEWEAMPNTTLGIRYIHRNIGRVLEDISPYSAVGLRLRRGRGVLDRLRPHQPSDRARRRRR